MAVGGAKLNDVKITDFGIAKMAEEEIAEAVEGGDQSLTASQTAIGALPYMAPEMIHSIKDADKPADVWSLGAMMFELLTGQKPFGTGLKSVPAILKAEVPGLPGAAQINAQFLELANSVHELASACLQASPSKRPTADDLVSRCENLCYPEMPREYGTVQTIKHRAWGFITADEGASVFFHLESVYGGEKLAVGDRVLFSRHVGGGKDRAFPVTKMLPQTILDIF
jgi:serine/threonine-protein kinase